MRAGTSPALARLSHVHTNSGQFSMKTATVSPLVMETVSASSLSWRV